jgi:hypothetical protein
MNNDDAPQQKDTPEESAFISGVRYFLLYFIPFLVYSVGFLPAVVFFWVFLRFYPLGTGIDLLVLPLFITFELGVILLSEFLISGVILWLFRVRYAEGSYVYSITDWMTFKWMLVCSMYTPFRKIMEIIPMGPFRLIYLRLLGMKIGKNTLVGGTIKDPCMTELGDNVTMGEYAVLYAHIQNMEQETMWIAKVRVGNNCIIGAGAILMPGVTMEDNVILAAGSVVPKNHVLKSGKIYVGNPVKELDVAKKH